MTRRTQAQADVLGFYRSFRRADFRARGPVGQHKSTQLVREARCSQAAQLTLDLVANLAVAAARHNGGTIPQLHLDRYRAAEQLQLTVAARAGFGQLTAVPA